MPMGRMDEVRAGKCKKCDGSGERRKKPCFHCGGDGRKWICISCGEEMPCSGTEEDVLDQTWCTKSTFIGREEEDNVGTSEQS